MTKFDLENALIDAGYYEGREIVALRATDLCELFSQLIGLSDIQVTKDQTWMALEKAMSRNSYWPAGAQSLESIASIASELRKALDNPEIDLYKDVEHLWEKIRNMLDFT